MTQIKGQLTVDLQSGNSDVLKVYSNLANGAQLTTQSKTYNGRGNNNPFVMIDMRSAVCP